MKLALFHADIIERWGHGAHGSVRPKPGSVNALFMPLALVACRQIIASSAQNGQVQLRAHARAAFASHTIGSMNHPFAMLFHIELA